MNVRLDGPGTTDASGRFVCGALVPLRGDKRVKGCMARIVPNYSVFKKHNNSSRSGAVKVAADCKSVAPQLRHCEQFPRPESPGTVSDGQRIVRIIKGKEKAFCSILSRDHRLE